MKTKKRKAPPTLNDWPKVEDAFKVPFQGVQSFEVKACKATVSGKSPWEGTQEFLEESFSLASNAIKTKQERKQGGANSHEMSEIDRRERNEQIQREIDRLCLDKKLTFKSARVLVAKKHSLHPDTLKKIVKNPLK